jgi:hypothetical protein
VSYNEVGNVLVDQGKFRDALEAYQQSLKKLPDLNLQPPKGPV